MGDARSGGLPELGGADGESARRVALAEIVGLWLVTLLLIRAVKDVVALAHLPEILLAIVPILFMYAPVVVCRLRGVDSWDYPLALPAFRDRAAWLDAAKLAFGTIGVILLPWLVAYHVWQTIAFPWILGALGHHVPGWHFRGTWPRQLGLLIGYHLFFVAIPEEMFYRGYVQSRLDEVFPRKWRVMGADLGWGWILAALFFAFGHSVVSPQWWHFATFFPGLVFGWMRQRTGGIVAGALFHAWANVQVTTLDTLYGVIPVNPS